MADECCSSCESGDVAVATRNSTTLPSDARAKVVRRVLVLSWLSLAYMTIEGGVALVAGIIANSPALVGFAIDSVIEGLASLVIVWRFTGARALSEAAEHRAQRLVAIQFFILAPYVAYESLDALLNREEPHASWVGIVLAITSFVVMRYLGAAKIKASAELDSAATKGEGRQNILCAYLSAALLVGLAGNALFGLWWLDPAVGLLIAVVAIQEGREAWRGESCAC